MSYPQRGGSKKPNAALSGEQRRPLNSKHCAVNTETEVNQKCRTLGIRLKCFVMSLGFKYE
ncbi:hypothetical protein EAY32_17715, partial [Vibrio anguillarum]|nr:hypothetical protein [Vibrio anguillarum]